MARTIIYAQMVAPPSSSRITFGGPAPKEEPRPAFKVDDYKDKLVKYVPAEVVAFYAPIATLVQERPGLLILAAVLGMVATPTYLLTQAKKLEPTLRPPLYNYVLSSIAFAVWALSTSRLGAMAGMDSVTTAFLLGVTVFLLPLVDTLLVRSPQPVRT